jgi:hemerythrin-like metal-binding protein
MTVKVAPLFVWREEYSIHHQQVDEQHKELVGCLNALHEALLSGESHQEMDKLLSELVRHTLVHFRDEEELMRQCNYPGLRSHHAAHEDLERQVGEFQNRLRSGRVTLSVDLLKFLKSWLQHHMQGADQEFGKYIAAKKLN